MNIRKSILLRVRIAFLIIFLIGLAIMAKIVHLQFIEGEKWTKLADQISLQYREVSATRGNIYSDNGSLLATSLPEYRVAFDPTVASDNTFSTGIDSLSILLSKHFGDNTATYYKRKITNARLAGRQYIILNRQLVKYQEKKKMNKWPIFRNGRLGGGVIFEKINKRFAPFHNMAKRTIGFINENNQGAGLEYSFNQLLAGSDGQALFQKFAGGNWKPVYDGSEIRPNDGQDIVTTIDINIQDVAESALLSALLEHDADYGSVVVMEVNTGEIKAISNLRKKRGYYLEDFNYAVGHTTEPGSTFKLVSMMALLEQSNINLTDSIETGDGKFQFYDQVMADHKPGGYGKITVREAFEKSSNIAISRMINEEYGLEPKSFIEFIKNLGLMQPLGFQLAGEGMPYIKSPDDPSWSGISLPWMSIGYELKLTPLQVLTLYNSVANQGKMIQPIIVKQSKQADDVINTYQPAIINKKICSQKTLQQLQTLLEGAVSRGTASNINNSHYKIAGKTGTAQKVKSGGGYSKKYYTSFVGYFPANAPRFSCIVVIDNPKSFNQYGSDVAAPVFKTIADKIYSLDIELHAAVVLKSQEQKGIFPVIQAGNKKELAMICSAIGIENKSAHEADWVKAKIASPSTIAWQENQNEIGTVPDVTGMRLRDALYLLENAGLRVFHSGQGRVSRQSLAANSKIKKGSTVKLELKEWPY